MSRYSTLEPQPSKLIREGDDRFVGMNMGVARDKLPPGYYPYANNKRIDGGRLATRGGTIKPVFANVIAFPSILGSGVYSNPNGDEMLLIATPTKVYAIRDGTYPTEIPVVVGETLAAPVEFSQEFDKVLLHRGRSATTPTLVWDGVSVAGFVVKTESNPDATATVITPNVEWSVNMGDRSVFPVSRDEIGATDVLDYTSYDDVNAKFRVNTGTADRIMGAYPYVNNSVIVGKRHSIDVLANFFGDLSTTNVQIISTTVGIAARKAAKMAGADLLFLYDSGFYRVNQVLESRLQASPLPLGARPFGPDEQPVDPIGPLLKRINWRAAGNAVAAMWGPYYLPAVPIDGSTVNNAVFAYNSVSDQWEGFDTWPAAAGFQIDDLHVSLYQGVRRVWAIDRANRAIYILYEGRSDNLAKLYTNGVISGTTLTSATAAFTSADRYKPIISTSVPAGTYVSAVTSATVVTLSQAGTNGSGVAFNIERQYEVSESMESRGYAELGENAATSKDFKRVIIGLSTWRPSVNVTAIFDGENNERALTTSAIAKNRVKYYTFGKPDYDPSNVNGDHVVPGREDYSADVTSGFYLGAGAVVDQKQERMEKFSLHGRGRFVSYRVASSQGQCDVAGLLTESQGKGEVKRAA